MGPSGGLKAVLRMDTLSECDQRRDIAWLFLVIQGHMGRADIVPQCLAGLCYSLRLLSSCPHFLVTVLVPRGALPMSRGYLWDKRDLCGPPAFMSNSTAFFKGPTGLSLGS